MKKNFLKKIRDKMPEFLKYIAAPLFRNKLVKNKEFRKYYDLLETRENLNSLDIEKYQINELKNILIYSFQYVPYYHELFKQVSFDPFQFTDFNQLKKIPFLTREIINQNYDKLISTKKIKNGHYVGRTGGSSGLPLKFLLDYDSIFKENAFIYYYRKKLGYEFGDRTATFRNIEFGDRLWQYNPMHNELIFSNIKQSKMTIEKYATKLNDYKPQYFNGYLSAIWYFAKLMEEYQISLNFKLKGIFLASENIDLKQRKFIEQFFGAKSITHYGHSERCVLAEEKMSNKYQFDPYYGYVEIINIEKNKYSIVGTGFLNMKMPLIRYKTDDICTPQDRYYSIDGKRNNSIGIYGINNELFTSTGFVLDYEVFQNIITYQFVQEEKGKAEMRIIVNKEFQMEEIIKIKKALLLQTKGILKIDVKVVERLILSPRGKYQRYISKVNNE